MDDASVLSDELLSTAIQSQATDIHFYPHNEEVHIYFRILGQRNLQQTISHQSYQFLLTYFKFTSGMDIGENKKPQDGTMSYRTTAYYSLRLSTLPVRQTESLAIRILSQDHEFTLDQLFLFPNQSAKMKKWFTNQTGIILFTGPTGSGKTTTLYALLQAFIAEKRYQTVTLEDPVEKNIEHILQVQVNEKAGITYQSGLKAALRHDPDIIMVGELRDEEVAKFAFRASLTGHLVLSTLHARDATGTIDRLLEMGLTETDLQQSLVAVAALKLIPIQINNKIVRRAAIVEILDGECLHKQINGDITHNQLFHSFNHLRKKAYAYGYISKEDFFHS